MKDDFEKCRKCVYGMNGEQGEIYCFNADNDPEMYVHQCRLFKSKRQFPHIREAVLGDWHYICRSV